jgi:hypothetical protein
MCDKENAKKLLTQLFEQLTIRKVVFVDDQYSSNPSVEEIIGLCTEKGLASCKEIPTFNKMVNTPIDDIWEFQVKSSWEKLTREEKISTYNELIQSTQDNDKKSASIFSEFLSEILSVTILSLDEWNQQKTELIRSADETQTLFLFDKDLSKNGGRDNEGYHLVLETLTARQHKPTLCGILSHVFSEGEEYECWTKIKMEYHIEPHQCILISKQRLNSLDFMGFAYMIKLTVLNPYCNDLKERFSELINNANNKTKEEIDQINIYDFEYLIFYLSHKESISELDTLLRINNLFFKKYAQKIALDDTRFISLTNQIRQFAQSCYDTKIIPQLSTWKIQREEIYIEGENLNSYHYPIELGDIFEKTTSPKKYILIGQPCDLMIRKEGERNRYIAEAILAEIVNEKPENGWYYELPYFDKTTGNNYYVSFRKSYNIELWILDLCVYQKDGTSKININNICPELALPSLKLYYDKICKQGEAIFKQYEEIKKVTDNTTLHKLVLTNLCDKRIFKGDISIKGNEQTISFGCKRIMRLNQPWSSALLTEFTQYCARTAYNNDFGKVS